MRAVRYWAYGGPEVLRVEDAPEPSAGPGHIRIRVEAASVNPVDWKIRSGRLQHAVARTFPITPGSDASGTVDQVGDGVAGVQVGDRVFGLGTGAGTLAEFAELRAWAPLPDEWTFAQGAAAGLAVDTAVLALDAVGEVAGRTLLIEGAAGGVGSAAVELARARGARVIGTASPGKHDFVRSLGAVPVTYGPGLAERVATLAPGGIDAAVDMVGSGSLAEIIGMVGEPRRVASIADHGAPAMGATFVLGGGDSHQALAEAARAGASGAYTPRVTSLYELDEAAQAHRLSEAGHVAGKIVMRVGATPEHPGG